MRQWEYQTWTCRAMNEQSNQFLMDAGKEGWELVAVIGDMVSVRFPNGGVVFFFKRPVVGTEVYR